METSNNRLDFRLLEELEAVRAPKENKIKALEKEIKAIQKELKGDDELIRVLRSRLGVASSPQKTSGYGSKAEILRQAIKQVTLTCFTRFDIEKEINRINPDMEVDESWINTALWSLNKHGKLIKTVVSGSSQNAAQYEKLPANAAEIKRPNKEKVVPK